LDDENALDGLAFAYAELTGPKRRALTRAVLQDAADPTQALATFLAVEENPRARRHLAELLGRYGRIHPSAQLEGNEEQGEALLIQSLQGLEIELLKITWEGSEIKEIALESRRHFDFKSSRPAVEPQRAAETLAPLLWRYIRAGGQIPAGIERFAGFFSAG